MGAASPSLLSVGPMTMRHRNESLQFHDARAKKSRAVSSSENGVTVGSCSRKMTTSHLLSSVGGSTLIGFSTSASGVSAALSVGDGEALRARMRSRAAAAMQAGHLPHATTC